MKLRVEVTLVEDGPSKTPRLFGSTTTIEHPILTLEMSDTVKLELINAIVNIVKTTVDKPEQGPFTQAIDELDKTEKK